MLIAIGNWWKLFRKWKNCAWNYKAYPNL